LLDIKDGVYIKRKYPDVLVLLLGPIDYSNLHLCEKYNIEVTITDISQIKYLSKFKLNVQIEINSGMNRFGIKVEDFNSLYLNDNLTLTGIYSHNATTDTIHINNQLLKFYEVINNKRDIDLHFQSSSTIDFLFKYVNSKRIGVYIYEDAFYVYGNIIQINHSLKGEYVGYDYSYQIKDDCYIAVIDIGYSDGLERLCEGFLVYINSKFYPLVGRSCMNHCFVLIDESVSLKSKVIFIGKENNICNYLSYFNKIKHEVYLAYLKK
jgi:alanine racemase